MKVYLTYSFVLFVLGLSGCAPWNAKTRKLGSPTSIADSAYIESRRETGPNYGCSFIEFDGKGGFLDFGQFKHALSRLDELKARSGVLLVLYCHGWNNNPQSADVIRFVGFLKRLADSEPIRARHLRVEGGTTKKSMRQTIGLLQFHETLSGIIMIFGRNLVWRCSPAYIGLSSNWGENQPLPNPKQAYRPTETADFFEPNGLIPPSESKRSLPRNRAHAQSIFFDYIETFYNPKRLIDIARHPCHLIAPGDTILTKVILTSSAIYNNMADFPIKRIAEFTPGAWAARN